MKQMDKYAAIKTKIAEIYHKHKGRYGYRRITLELRNGDTLINHKTVQRLMGVLGLKSMVRMRKYRSYRGETGTIAPNVLNREFTASKPNVKWVTDVTEFSLFGQKVYLSPILDLYNGEIVSYSVSARPTFDFVMNMLDAALTKIPADSGLIIHSDQGWQYQHSRYQLRLKKKGIIQSMSRKGNCLDNAVMENFFGHVKSELLYLMVFTSIEHFYDELTDYMDYYNHSRIKTKLNGLSPVQYRTQAFASA
jgi:transposase InsO family protein